MHRVKSIGPKSREDLDKVCPFRPQIEENWFLKCEREHNA